jgi:hypothetical protein
LIVIILITGKTFIIGTWNVREEDQRIHAEETWKRIGVILVKAGEN